MKIYCQTNVSGYKIFDVSRFKKTDENGCSYVTADEITHGKMNPDETVYVLRSNNCGLSQKTIDLFFDSNILLMTKKDDGDNSTQFNLLYVDNVGDSTLATNRNDSKSFVFVAENENDDSLLRRLGASLASGNRDLSKKLHSIIFINVINDETVLYFDNNKWKEAISMAMDYIPNSREMNLVTKGLKHIIICNNIPESTLAKYIHLDNSSQYVIIGTKAILDNGFFLGLNKKKTLCVILSALAAICIGYIMLKRN